MTPPPPPPGGSPDGLRILVVDDDDTFRSRLARALVARRYTVVEAADFDAALARVAETADCGGIDRAIVDLRMPGRSGLELVRALRARSPQTEIVVLTGYASVPTAVEAVRAGAINYLAKPAHADAILGAFSPIAASEKEATSAAERATETRADHATEPPTEPPTEIGTPSLASIEWEHIHRVLEDVDGNVSEAARRLGLHRRTLQRKLSKYPPPR